MNTAVVLAAVVGALAAFGPKMMHQMEDIVATGLKQSGNPSLATAGGVQTLTMWGLKSLLVTLGPCSASRCGAGLLANILQVKLRFSLSALKPSLTKLNPGPGLQAARQQGRARRGAQGGRRRRRSSAPPRSSP